MGEIGDAVRELDRAQKVIEYALAVVIPVILAIMLYSYVLYDDIFQPLFVASVVAAVLLLYPAYRALKLHYLCWSKNAMPHRLATGLVGTIYISAASVFGVSLISSSRGLDPEQPLTFAVLGSFVLMLLGVMAYNSKYKEKFERTEIRFYRKLPSRVVQEIKDYLAARSEEYALSDGGKRSVFDLPKSKVTVTVSQQHGSSSEVMIECAEPASSELCEGLKRALDRGV